MTSHPTDPLDEIYPRNIILGFVDSYVATTPVGKKSVDKAVTDLIAWRDKAVREARRDELEKFRELEKKTDGSAQFGGKAYWHMINRLAQLAKEEE